MSKALGVTAVLVLSWLASARVEAAAPRLPRGCRNIGGGPTGIPGAMGATERWEFDCGVNIGGESFVLNSRELARNRFDQLRRNLRQNNRFGNASFEWLEGTRTRGLEILHVVVIKGSIVFEIKGAEWQRQRIERLARQFAAAN